MLAVNYCTTPASGYTQKGQQRYVRGREGGVCVCVCVCAYVRTCVRVCVLDGGGVIIYYQDKLNRNEIIRWHT